MLLPRFASFAPSTPIAVPSTSRACARASLPPSATPPFLFPRSSPLLVASSVPSPARHPISPLPSSRAVCPRPHHPCRPSLPFIPSRPRCPSFPSVLVARPVAPPCRAAIPPLLPLCPRCSLLLSPAPSRPHTRSSTVRPCLSPAPLPAARVSPLTSPPTPSRARLSAPPFPSPLPAQSQDPPALLPVLRHRSPACHPLPPHSPHVSSSRRPVVVESCAPLPIVSPSRSPSLPSPVRPSSPSPPFPSCPPRTSSPPLLPSSFSLFSPLLPQLPTAPASPLLLLSLLRGPLHPFPAVFPFPCSIVARRRVAHAPSQRFPSLRAPLPPLRMLRRCTQCYGWKKQITRARAAAKKAGRNRRWAKNQRRHAALAPSVHRPHGLPYPGLGASADLRPARPPRFPRRLESTERGTCVAFVLPRASNSQHPRSAPDPSAAFKRAQCQALPVLRPPRAACCIEPTQRTERSALVPLAQHQARARACQTQPSRWTLPHSNVPMAFGWSALPPQVLGLPPNVLQPSPRLHPNVYSPGTMLLACCEVVAAIFVPTVGWGSAASGWDARALKRLSA
ncbi:hypothetical protein B0H15DRAFT_955469 [Mycena belliarum]|uniref:Uncharacterized protein n=1 Tax=Mycena belliarum TaxID=1033014 RepID=A0AAD6TT70_9AGAR|nr:hypothetical protein B0H15DRAFT_955469 [Mycena belliae]